MKASTSPTSHNHKKKLLPVLLYGAYFSALLAVSLIDAEPSVAAPSIPAPKLKATTRATVPRARYELDKTK